MIPSTSTNSITNIHSDIHPQPLYKQKFVQNQVTQNTIRARIDTQNLRYTLKEIVGRIIATSEDKTYKSSPCNLKNGIAYHIEKIDQASYQECPIYENDDYIEVAEPDMGCPTRPMGKDGKPDLSVAPDYKALKQRWEKNKISFDNSYANFIDRAIFIGDCILQRKSQRETYTFRNKILTISSLFISVVSFIAAGFLRSKPQAKYYALLGTAAGGICLIQKYIFSKIFTKMNRMDRSGAEVIIRELKEAREYEINAAREEGTLIEK